MTVTYCLIVEYSGKYFCGWQRQPNVKTVQSELERAVRLFSKQENVRIISSSRTDSGVSARNQVVRLRLEEEIDTKRLAKAVSSILKNTCSVKYIEKVPVDFHPRHNVIEKQYSYRIFNSIVPPVLDYGFVWHVSQRIDIDRLKTEADALVGKFDFTSFRASGCQAVSPVKTIYGIDISYKKGLILISIRGSGFLKQMIRIIIGSLVDIQKGRLKVDSISELLLAKNRLLAGVTAPGYGLQLDWTKFSVGIGSSCWTKSSEVESL